MNRAMRRKAAHERKKYNTALRMMRIDPTKFEGAKAEDVAKALLKLAYGAYKNGMISRTQARMFGCVFAKYGR